MILILTNIVSDRGKKQFNHEPHERGKIKKSREFTTSELPAQVKAK
jgi:hypothetical protein